eukprot:939727-Rhodomonas_salina.1
MAGCWTYANPRQAATDKSTDPHETLQPAPALFVGSGSTSYPKSLETSVRVLNLLSGTTLASVSPAHCNVQAGRQT